MQKRGRRDFFLREESLFKKIIFVKFSFSPKFIVFLQLDFSFF